MTLAATPDTPRPGSDDGAGLAPSLPITVSAEVK